MNVGDLVTWNGYDALAGASQVVKLKSSPKSTNGNPWSVRVHLVRWFDTWDLDPLGYHLEELRIVSRVWDT